MQDGPEHVMPGFSPNDLRRTCCTWLLACGQSRDHVRKVMGHADGRMIDRVYDQTTPEQLRALMLGCSTGAGRSEPPMAKLAKASEAQAAESAGNKGWLTGLEPATPGVTVRGPIAGKLPPLRPVQDEEDAAAVPAHYDSGDESGRSVR
jgi:hypothetical protein